MVNKKDKKLQSNEPKQKKPPSLVRKNSINSGKPNFEHLQRDHARTVSKAEKKEEKALEDLLLRPNMD